MCEKNLLKNSYQTLISKYKIEDNASDNRMDIIKSSIADFTENHNKPAIYCYGTHTKLLMADFMFELRKVRYIIDNYIEKRSEQGFCIIDENEIDQKGIDGIIISSFKFRKEIMTGLKSRYPDIDVLDIYQLLENHKIFLNASYFHDTHPYNRYSLINTLQRAIYEYNQTDVQTYQNLIFEYIRIKDFRLAALKAFECYRISGKNEYKQFGLELEKLYLNEISAVSTLDSKHVVMICVDGLRRSDFFEKLPTVYHAVKQRGKILSNAYSYSTSTFESLIPSYGENLDFRTNYYSMDSIDGKNCRFINLAKKQGRHIRFYTDMINYINDRGIQYSKKWETVSEKIWDWLIDAENEECGLYYLHILYESHFSFANPYTKGFPIFEGTAMLFDYLEKNGGKLRTDYEQQHNDAMQYLDDTLAPFLQVLPCKFVMYADHGNILLSSDTNLKDVHPNYYTCHEDWIRIPFIIGNNHYKGRNLDQLFSLTSINDIIIGLINDEPIDIPKQNYVKFARSELYNPDFRYLYKMIGEERRLLAFEGFIFSAGYKLIVYSNCKTELFDLNDNEILDDIMKKQLLRIVADDITVTDIENINGIYEC